MPASMLLYIAQVLPIFSSQMINPEIVFYTNYSALPFRIP